MIQEFVDKWNTSARAVVRAQVSQKHVTSYGELVRMVVAALAEGSEYGGMDASKIHQIDDGDYQGTLLFIIPEACYQPSTYWSVKVSYGSCSGCDTLQRIHSYDDETPTEQQVADYMSLALHIVQWLKEI